MDNKILWIEAKETVHRNIGLVIGRDISQEQADRWLALEEDELETITEEYGELTQLLGDNISDSDGLTDIYIHVEKEK